MLPFLINDSAISTRSEFVTEKRVRELYKIRTQCVCMYSILGVFSGKKLSAISERS